MEQYSDYFQQIVDTVPMFFFLWDIERKETIFISESFYHERQHSYHAPEEPREDLRQYIAKDSQDRYDRFFEQLSSANDFNDEIELKAADNLENIDWMVLKTYPVPEEDHGKVTRIAGHIRDITYEKEHYQTLQEQVQSLDTVTFMLAHELTAPVTNMMGLSEFLKTKVDTADQKQYRHLYDTVYNYGGEVLTLVRGLVNLIYLQASDKDMEREEVPLQSFIEQRIQNFYLKNHLRNRQRINAVIPQEVTAEVNRGKFGQAVDEIVLYLLKIINSDQTVSILLLDPSLDKEQHQLYICSDYLELPQEPIKKVLSTTSRLNLMDVKRMQPSSMLELLIAKEIVELHEGRLELYQSNDHQGFVISLPA